MGYPQTARCLKAMEGGTEQGDLTNYGKTNRLRSLDRARTAKKTKNYESTETYRQQSDLITNSVVKPPKGTTGQNYRYFPSKAEPQIPPVDGGVRSICLP
jgi:hypothetical protein